MTDPLVSVVIPVHDRARFLGASIASVLEQRYEPLEVIVVDDGSGDGSAQVAADHGARVIRQPRRGVSAARNAGVEAARGELITFQDADDLWPADRLAVQVPYLRDRPELDFVLGYSMLFIDRDEPTPDWLTEDWLAGVQTVPLPGVEITGPGKAGPVPAATTLMARAELFDRLGGFDGGYAVGEDMDWLMRAADAGAGYEMVPHVLLHYRMHGANTSYRVAEGANSLLRLLRASVARKRTATA